MASNTSTYTIRDYRRKGAITVRSHTRVSRPYTKNKHWYERLGAWIWSWLRTPVIYSLGMIIFASFVTASWFGGELWETYHPTEKAMAQIITQTIQVPVTIVPPVMKRIAKAETHDDQFCNADAIHSGFCAKTQSGEVLETTNVDKSVDIGAYAINNKAYGAKAVQLGYDIYTEQGNEDMAMWIYQNEGTGPWYSSRNRWQ